MPDVSSVRVILPRTQVVRVSSSTPGPVVVAITGFRGIGTGGGGGNDFTLNGSTGSVSLVAGNNITLQSNASTITIVGGAGGGTNFTLNGSTGSVSLVAGQGIGLASNLSTITISNSSPFTTISARLVGNTLGAASTSFSFSQILSISGDGIVSIGGSGQQLTISATTNSVVSAIGTAGALSTGSIVLVAGNNITLNTGASSITIVGPSPGAGAATQSFSGGGTSVTGTAISVALFGGNNVSLASASGAGSLSLTVNASSNALNNVSLLNASSGAMSVSAGAGIGIGQANSTLTISASVQTASVSMTALGNTTVSSSGTHTNLINISGAGAVSVGVGAQSITISAPIATNFSTVSLSASGNTTGATSSGTFNNVLAFSGMGAISVGAGNGSVSISAPLVTNFVLDGTSSSVSISAGAGIGIGQANSTITISASVQTSSLSVTALGNTLGAASTSLAVSNALNISGAGIVSVGMNGSTITISAPSAAAGTVSMTALGNTTSSSSGTYAGLLNISGAGGVSVGAGAQSMTISGPVQSSLVAGANISLSSAGSTITIIGVPSAISLTQNDDLGLVAGTIVSKAGTVTGTAGVGSSLFLQRVNLPGKMSLSEIDVAMSIGFPATNQGAGTMSRSMVIYSFGNSTSLATVASASGTSAWNTGTSTAGASSSLTQFQGGWSSPLIQPFTFASTSLSAGDYVVGQLFNFAQGSSTWTLNFYGAQAVSTFLASAATNLTSATLGAMSSGGLSSGSLFSATTNITLSSMSIAAASGINAITQNATNNISWFVSRATSAVTSVASATSSFTFLEAPFVGSIGTVAGSIITASTAATALSNAGLLSGSFHTASGSLGAVTNVALGALNSSTLAQLGLPAFGFIGTGSTTSGFPTAFMAGIMSTGAVPTAITLTSAAVTYSGSIAFQQPWWALAGA